MLPAVAFSGIKPNLLIILVAAYGFMNGEKNGTAGLDSLFCGLLADIFSGNVIGLLCAALYADRLRQRHLPEDVLSGGYQAAVDSDFSK